MELWIREVTLQNYILFNVLGWLIFHAPLEKFFQFLGNNESKIIACTILFVAFSLGSIFANYFTKNKGIFTLLESYYNGLNSKKKIFFLILFFSIFQILTLYSRIF